MAEVDRRERDLGAAPDADLPLSDPYPEYVACPQCGEPEVEIWSNQARVQCHTCGQWIARAPANRPDAPEEPHTQNE